MPGRKLSVAVDHFTDDKLHQLLDEGRIEFGLLGEGCQAFVLKQLSVLVYRRQLMSGFKQTDLISTAESFSKHVDERGVDIVDGLSECRELMRDVGIFHG